MTTYRHSQYVKHLPTGSIGVTQYPVTGGWRVWFEAARWKGDPALIHPDRLVKLDVPENELRPE